MLTRLQAFLYIAEAMESSDSLHSEATNELNPELPPSRPSSPARVPPSDHLPLGRIPRDAHWPSWLRKDDAYHYERDVCIRQYVREHFPELGDVLQVPPPHRDVSEELNGCWACPTCAFYFEPYNLTCNDLETIDHLRGWPFAREHKDTGRFYLDTANPSRFLRYVDALAWEHISAHLATIGIRLIFPHPELPYKVSSSSGIYSRNLITHRAV